MNSSDGKHFKLTSTEGWQGFEVGAGDDFAREGRQTVRNKKLVKALAGRRTRGKRIPLDKVKRQLGLD